MVVLGKLALMDIHGAIDRPAKPRDNKATPDVKYPGGLNLVSGFPGTGSARVYKIVPDNPTCCEHGDGLLVGDGHKGKCVQVDTVGASAVGRIMSKVWPMVKFGQPVKLQISVPVVFTVEPNVSRFDFIASHVSCKVDIKNYVKSLMEVESRVLLAKYHSEAFHPKIIGFGDDPGSNHSNSPSQNAHEHTINQARVAEAQPDGGVAEAQGQGEQNHGIAKIHAETTGSGGHADIWKDFRSQLMRLHLLPKLILGGFTEATKNSLGNSVIELTAKVLHSINYGLEALQKEDDHFWGFHDWKTVKKDVPFETNLKDSAKQQFVEGLMFQCEMKLVPAWMRGGEKISMAQKRMVHNKETELLKVGDWVMKSVAGFGGLV